MFFYARTSDIIQELIYVELPLEKESLSIKYTPCPQMEL